MTDVAYLDALVPDPDDDPGAWAVEPSRNGYHHGSPEIREITLHDDQGAPFEGLAHADALAVDLESLGGGQLIEDLVERGTLGHIAGIPETHKSWTAQAIAFAVAHGAGYILGQRVLEQTPVGYFWQDDSQRNELERIQTFARVRDTPENLELRWFLNEGMRLPDDLARLRATIEQHRLGLVCLDSFYNLSGAVEGRDAGEIFAAIKSEICDATGCTSLIVDHAPWPSDSNRGQMRGIGDVHKAAAARWGIYIAREKTKLYLEARGNNIRGIPRTPVYWDEETLELRLVDTDADARDLEAEITDWLTGHPYSSGNAIAAGVKAGKKRVSDLLKASPLFTAVDGPNRAHLWVPSGHENHRGNLFAQDAPVGSPPGSPPIGGTEEGTTGVGSPTERGTA